MTNDLEMIFFLICALIYVLEYFEMYCNCRFRLGPQYINTSKLVKYTIFQVVQILNIDLRELIQKLPWCSIWHWRFRLVLLFYFLFILWKMSNKVILDVTVIWSKLLIEKHFRYPYQVLWLWHYFGNHLFALGIVFIYR